MIEQCHVSRNGTRDNQPSRRRVCVYAKVYCHACRRVTAPSGSPPCTNNSPHPALSSRAAHRERTPWQHQHNASSEHGPVTGSATAIRARSSAIATSSSSGNCTSAMASATAPSPRSSTRRARPSPRSAATRPAPTADQAAGHGSTGPSPGLARTRPLRPRFQSSVSASDLTDLARSVRSVQPTEHQRPAALSARERRRAWTSSTPPLTWPRGNCAALACAYATKHLDHADRGEEIHTPLCITTPITHVRFPWNIGRQPHAPSPDAVSFSVCAEAADPHRGDHRHGTRASTTLVPR